MGSAISPERVPIGVTDNKLGEWGLADVQYTVLNAVIESECGGRSDAGTWRQLLHVNYQDGARMQMLAGVIGAPAMNRALDQCRLDDLDTVRTGREPATPSAALCDTAPAGPGGRSCPPIVYWLHFGRGPR